MTTGKIRLTDMSATCRSPAEAYASIRETARQLALMPHPAAAGARRDYSPTVAPPASRNARIW